MENKEISLEQAIVFLEMNAYEGSNAKAVLRMGDVHEVLKPIKGLIDKSAKMESYIKQLERENKVTIYKGEVMHDLKALFDNAGDYFEDEYELVKQYIEQLEQENKLYETTVDDITKEFTNDYSSTELIVIIKDKLINLLINLSNI